MDHGCPTGCFGAKYEASVICVYREGILGACFKGENRLLTWKSIFIPKQSPTWGDPMTLKKPAHLPG